MKKVITVLFFLLISNSSYSIAPTYNLFAHHFTMVANNAFEFDIYIQWTNQGSSDPFYYGITQYCLTVNPAAIAGQTWTVQSVGSDLPHLLQIAPPMANTPTAQIRVASQYPSELFLVSSTFPGTKVTRLRVTTNAAYFPCVNLNPQWRNSGTGLTTKIAYMLALRDQIIITDTNSHLVEVPFNFTICNPPAPSLKTSLKVTFQAKYDVFFLDYLLARKDSVSVYLRKTTPPYIIKDSAKGGIDSILFSGLFSFSNAPTDSYYVVVKHPQCIETWSRSGGEYFLFGSLYNYDFTNSASQAFGNNMTLKINKYSFYSGDLDKSGSIDVADVILVYNDQINFVTGNAITDVNGDYTVDSDDLLIVYNNAQSFVSVIRP